MGTRRLSASISHAYPDSRIPPFPPTTDTRQPRSRRSSKGRVERTPERSRPERAFEARDDHAVAVDREQPRLSPEVERPQLGAYTSARLVVDVDLFVEEGDAAPVLMLQLDRDVSHRPAHPRLAERGRREQEDDRALAEHRVE